MRFANERCRIQPLLAVAGSSLNEFGATHTKDQVWEAIYRGHSVLWPGENAVILTTMIIYPIGIKCCSVWLQGGELAELKTMYPTIEKYARAQGCDWLIGWGRDGWVKAMPGWAELRHAAEESPDMMHRRGIARSRMNGCRETCGYAGAAAASGGGGGGER